MSAKKIRTELEDLLRNGHQISVIYDRGSFHGGYARIYEEKKLLINKSLPDEEKASILARTILESGFPLDTLKPGTREFLERFR